MAEQDELSRLRAENAQLRAELARATQTQSVPHGQTPAAHVHTHAGAHGVDAVPDPSRVAMAVPMGPTAVRRYGRQLILSDFGVVRMARPCSLSRA